MKSIFVLAIASLVATGASAQMSGMKPAVAAKPAMAAGPAKPAMTAKPARVATRTAPSGKTATATLKNGKKVTYDCSKKGNMTKTACKG